MKEVAIVVEPAFLPGFNLDSNLGFNTIEPEFQTWVPTQVTTLIEPGFNPDSNPVSNLRSNLGSIPKLKPELWAK